MEPIEYIPILNEIEKKFKVNKWMDNGFHIWPVIRVGVGFALDSISKKVIKDSMTSHIKNLLTDTFNYLYACIVDHSNNAKIEKSNFVFFTLTEERSVYYKEKWYNNYCDPIRIELEKVSEKSIILEYSSKGRYKLPRFSKSLFVQFSLNLRSIIAVLFQKSINPEILPDYLLFESYLLKNTDIDQKTIRKIFKRIIVIRIWADYLKVILEKVNPKIGFVVSFYGPYGMAFLLACHELRIPTVDLQHGVQGRSNVAYAEWIDCPNYGYETLPDVFWVWNEEDHQEKIKWLDTKGKHKSFLGGNLLLQKFKDKESDLSKYYSQFIFSFAKRENKIALITLQTTGINKYIKLIQEAPDNIFFLIRIHPLMLFQRKMIRSELNALGLKNWNLDQSTDFPLYSLLQFVDIHITEASAVVMEAESFNLPSIIIEEYAESFFFPQIQKGTTKIIVETDLIIQEIQKVEKIYNTNLKSEEESIISTIKKLEDLIS
jgi:hypothetical protein